MTPSGLLKPHEATALLREALAGITPDPALLVVIKCEELAVASGRRRVIQYSVDGLDAAGPSLIIAKVFTELRRAELLFEHLQALSAGPFAGGKLRVPQPLGFVSKEKLVLYRAGTGVPLDQLTDNTVSDAGVRAAAQWLARLHMSGVQLPRTYDPVVEVANTHEWAAVVGQHTPGVLGRAQRLASSWVPFEVASPAAYVPIHKDFHAGHVLVDTGVCVIDLDEARHGDPALDLAHFCTYLEWHGGLGEVSRDAFLQEYSRLTGWADHGVYARYAAYSWLKIAKQLALRSGPWRARDETAQWEVATAVERGMACLAR